MQLIRDKGDQILHIPIPDCDLRFCSVAVTQPVSIKIWIHRQPSFLRLKGPAHRYPDDRPLRIHLIMLMPFRWSMVFW